MAAFLFAALILVLAVLYSTIPTPSKTDEVTIENAKVEVSVADTFAEQSRGLAGVESLRDNEGMLFVFGTPGRYGFWMKGMKIPIDIIWLDKHGVVVDMKENVPPSSYRSNEDAETFLPARAASYVLEVRAGFAEAHGVKIGDTASFSLRAPSPSI